MFVSLANSHFFCHILITIFFFKLWKTQGKPRENSVKTHGKTRKTIEKPQENPRKNLGKTAGKPWENPGKTPRKPREDKVVIAQISFRLTYNSLHYKRILIEF